MATNNGAITNGYSCFLFLTFFFVFLFGLSHALDSVSPNAILRDNETLVSTGGVFELGFFSDPFTGNRYMGIWFKDDPRKRPVWVANRYYPLINSTCFLQIRDDGNLILIDRRLVPVIVNPGALSTSPNTTATLLDTGNFVLQVGAKVVWQSFDYPMDTYLPGMKIGWFGLTSDLPTIQVLSSWASPSNPTHGDFTLGVDYMVANLSVYRGDSAHSYFTFTTIGNYSMSWLVMASTGLIDEYTLSDHGISMMSHSLCEDLEAGSKRMLWAILGGSLVTIFLVAASLWCYNIRRKSTVNQVRSQDDANTSAVQVFILQMGTNATSINKETAAAARLELNGERDQELPMLSFSTIETATDYFAIRNILGEGGFGTVYKGRLPQGQEIAVKRLSTRSRQGIMEFKNEISLISKLQHKNVVSGYMSPEYAQDGLYSEKLDVFSFGIIVLEILSGKRNIASFETSHTSNLVGYAWNSWKEGKHTEFLDSTLTISCSSIEALRYLQIGLLCVQERPADRLSMPEVVSMLSNETTALPYPKEAALLGYVSRSTEGESSKNNQGPWVTSVESVVSVISPR
ncbi:hypothetical protein RHSIM_Rhsim02G0196300 [Rhododendron simsii]|uniref:Uncharacterized protein n=1 Tax=Rhododendron simsii TaxID=118357 RepID=A0A834HIE9_RHOSS|nr:hypothetical protein RHSIM_Rhsim02G0196300 [Rhododendron simsii]